MNANINTRIIQKHALEHVWLNTNFIPYKGEIVIYDSEVDAEGNVIAQLPDGRTTPYTYERVKVGDGVTSISALPFIDDDIRSQLDNKADKTELPLLDSYATKEYVAEQIANISIETPVEYTSIILKSSTAGSTKLKTR